MIERLRKLARAMRHTPDRLWHPVRRHCAVRRLRRMQTPQSVLFVCHGNICRSPYAAEMFSFLLPDPWRESVRISSAGFVGPGRPSPPPALEMAQRRGRSLFAHRSELLTPAKVAEADLVVVMDTRQQRALCGALGKSRKAVLLLGDLDPRAIDTRAILDPCDGPMRVFEESYGRIDRCVDELARALVGSAHGLEGR